MTIVLAPTALKIRKRGPSNADEKAVKPTAKKAKKTKDLSAGDDDDAENEGGTAKGTKKARAKKSRYVSVCRSNLLLTV